MKNLKSVVRVMYERTLSYNRPRPPSKPRAPRPANNNAVHCMLHLPRLSALGIWSLRLETHSWARAFETLFRNRLHPSRLLDPGAPNDQSTAVSTLPDDAVDDHRLVKMNRHRRRHRLALGHAAPLEPVPITAVAFPACQEL